MMTFFFGHFLRQGTFTSENDNIFIYPNSVIRPSDYDQKYLFGPKILEYDRKKLFYTAFSTTRICYDFHFKSGSKYFAYEFSKLTQN
jgi:hypothetical protein